MTLDPTAVPPCPDCGAEVAVTTTPSMFGAVYRTTCHGCGATDSALAPPTWRALAETDHRIRVLLAEVDRIKALLPGSGGGAA